MLFSFEQHSYIERHAYVKRNNLVLGRNISHPGGIDCVFHRAGRRIQTNTNFLPERPRLNSPTVQVRLRDVHK